MKKAAKKNCTNFKLNCSFLIRLNFIWKESLIAKSSKLKQCLVVEKHNRFYSPASLFHLNDSNKRTKLLKYEKVGKKRKQNFLYIQAYLNARIKKLLILMKIQRFYCFYLGLNYTRAWKFVAVSPEVIYFSWMRKIHINCWNVAIFYYPIIIKLSVLFNWIESSGFIFLRVCQILS